MGKVDLESVVFVNLLALAINYSEFHPTAQLISTVAASLYTAIKLLTP